MTLIIGVERVVMRGGFRLAPGVEMDVPEDVADDAVRAGFASYLTTEAQRTQRVGGSEESGDADTDVDAVVAGKGKKSGRRRGGGRAG